MSHDKVILKPKILFVDNTYQKEVVRNDNSISRSTSTKYGKQFKNKGRIFTAGGNNSKSFGL